MKLTTIMLFLTGVLQPMASYAQPSTSSYVFKSLASTGALIGTHTFTPSDAIDGLALSDAGEFAAVGRWTENGGEHSAVFTKNRIVAASGSVIDGKTILSINGASLAINNAGVVAYEAYFSDASGPHTGVFVEGHFSFSLNTAGGSGDFVLTAEGKAIPKAGIAASVAPPTSKPEDKKDSGKGGSIKLKKDCGGGKVGTWIRGLPIEGLCGGSSDNKEKADQKPSSSSSPLPQTLPPAKVCTAPAFPTPIEWNLGDEAGGGIASHLVESPEKLKPYDSQLYGRINAPIRVTQFTTDCKPILITISDSTARGRVEIWGPAGLVTYIQPSSGTFFIKGFPPINPGGLTRAETPIRTNARGQILMAVTFANPEGFAILLGSPNGGAR